MPTTYHDTKTDLVEALWRKMQECDAASGLIAYVSGRTLHMVPEADDIDGYNKLVDAIVECAWKRGVHDALVAVEIGAIAGIYPGANQGVN